MPTLNTKKLHIDLAVCKLFKFSNFSSSDIFVENLSKHVGLYFCWKTKILERAASTYFKKCIFSQKYFCSLGPLDPIKK